jgi:anti-sigma factor RsiW
MDQDGTTPQDVDLVRYLDATMSDGERRALDARLAVEPDLRDRLATLAAGGRPFLQSFEGLLAEAPVVRLAAALPGPRGTAPSFSLRGLAAWARRPRLAALAAALAVFAVGAAAGVVGAVRLAPEQVAESDLDNWRDMVAEYFPLTTSQSLEALPRDAATIASDLARVGERLNMQLDSDRVALPGRELSRVILYHVDGTPLAQIAYLDPESGPIAFCILAGSEGASPLALERRREMNMAEWSSDEHSFIVVGRAPLEVLEPLARRLAQQVGA